MLKRTPFYREILVGDDNIMAQVAPPGLNDMAPCYISAMVHLQNTDPAEYRQRLRSSSDQTRLIVSRSFKRAGDMSFTIAAARLWNDLPVYLRESQSLPMFKRQLKTHLFP